MSDQFRSFRHLTSHVKEQRRIYEQLDDAIADVSGLLDSIPEKKRLVEELEAKQALIQKSIEGTEESQKVLAEQFRKQRQELQFSHQKEQQERVTAREAFTKEKQGWLSEVSRLQAEKADLVREIHQKKTELETLEAELQSTVKAVLRR